MTPLPLKVVKEKQEQDKTPKIVKPKRKLKLFSHQARHFLGVLAALAVAMYGMDRIITTRTIDLARADGKLYHVFIGPTVDRLLLSNKSNKLLQENRAFAEQIVSWCVTYAYEQALPVALCLNMLRIESRFNPAALNVDSGATGASQHMPATHTQRLTREGIIKSHWLELHDMETAIQAWASTMGMYKRQTGSLERGVLKYGGWANKPNDPEAREYLRGALGI